MLHASNKFQSNPSFQSVNKSLLRVDSHGLTKRYEFHYDPTENHVITAISSAANQRTGSFKVDIQVFQTDSFIYHSGHSIWYQKR